MPDKNNAARHMQAIKEWVRRENKPGGIHRTSVDLMLLTDHRLHDRLESMENTRLLKEQPFVSSTPVLGPLIVGLRTIWNSISTKWYVLPIMQWQNKFNMNIVGGYTDLLQYLNHIVFFVRSVYTQLQNVETRLSEVETVKSLAPEVNLQSQIVNIETVVDAVEPICLELFITGQIAIFSSTNSKIIHKLIQHGLNVYGVVADQASVQHYVEQEIQAIHASDLEHLYSLSDQTMDGLLAVWQKPIPLQYMVRLLNQCQRVLKSDAWMMWIFPWSVVTDDTNARMARDVALAMDFQRVRFDSIQNPQNPFQLLAFQK